MKAGAFILFFSIVLTVYGLVNAYIFIRGWQAIPAGSALRPWFAVIFWTLAGSFVLARVMERLCPCLFTEIITWIGSFWLAFMLYFFLAVVMIDFLRLINHFFHIIPTASYGDGALSGLWVMKVVLVVVTLFVVAGFINARFPRVNRVQVHIDKPVSGDKHLRIVMASDIHLGTIIAKRKARRLVETINELKPDIVLFAGDVVDEDLAPVIRNDIGSRLLQIRSRLGVYGITGNHEYIGGAEKAVKYLQEHGITMLRDTAMLVDGRFYLVGREDRDRSRFSGKNRKELADLLKETDKQYPVIVLDHQPFNLAKAAGLGIDLQLSGHTHHGQLWPFNHITKAMYEVSAGYRKIGNAHFYVSTGFGTWGPPVRIGNRPEVVLIKVTFN